MTSSCLGNSICQSIWIFTYKKRECSYSLIKSFCLPLFPCVQFILLRQTFVWQLPSISVCCKKSGYGTLSVHFIAQNVSFTMLSLFFRSRIVISHRSQKDPEILTAIGWYVLPLLLMALIIDSSFLSVEEAWTGYNPLVCRFSCSYPIICINSYTRGQIATRRLGL